MCPQGHDALLMACYYKMSILFTLAYSLAYSLKPCYSNIQYCNNKIQIYVNKHPGQDIFEFYFLWSHCSGVLNILQQMLPKACFS